MRHRLEAVPVALWRLSSGVGMLAFLPAMEEQNPTPPIPLETKEEEEEKFPPSRNHGSLAKLQQFM